VPLPVLEAGGTAAFIFVDLEVKTGGDVLLRHVPGQAQLDQGANLVGHDFVAGRLDGRNDVVYEHQPILAGRASSVAMLMAMAAAVAVRVAVRVAMAC
jgi:hypothetical protein